MSTLDKVSPLDIPKRQYRSKIEITANILEIAKEGSRKTRIMYLGNLSFDLLQKYLKQLEKIGVLEVERKSTGERLYKITPKGEQFLADFYELQKHAEIADSKKQLLEVTLGTPEDNATNGQTNGQGLSAKTNRKSASEI